MMSWILQSVDVCVYAWLLNLSWWWWWWWQKFFHFCFIKMKPVNFKEKKEIQPSGIYFFLTIMISIMIWTIMIIYKEFEFQFQFFFWFHWNWNFFVYLFLFSSTTATYDEYTGIWYDDEYDESWRLFCANNRPIMRPFRNFSSPIDHTIIDCMLIIMIVHMINNVRYNRNIIIFDIYDMIWNCWNFFFLFKHREKTQNNNIFQKVKGEKKSQKQTNKQIKKNFKWTHRYVVIRFLYFTLFYGMNKFFFVFWNIEREKESFR